ncbi:MAG: HD domain-containing protein [Oscillospiraceae bacterium]|nr:HD domain-containing protein [Oscillospiraceae bacterium]MCL2279787.1 HD domain-containing protein [Oscillospiraceae bacterium]
MSLTINMDELIGAIANSLDIVEGEIVGASVNHGKRIAALCALMGKKLGMHEDELKALTVCALFHDCALTEYILYLNADYAVESLRPHCEAGQQNIEMLPFDTDVSGIILYHHEQADGGGPFGKKEGEYPLSAELIAITDLLDIKHHLDKLPTENLPLLIEEIEHRTEKCFTKTAAQALISVLDEQTLISLRNENIDETAEKLIPKWEVDIEGEAMMNLAKLVTKIIDYKSPFTKNHTHQIANRAWLMGEYYGYDHLMKSKIFLAASLHDLGKLAIPNKILDKPGKLTDSEFETIKGHVKGTYDLLSNITNFEEICKWASSHHEKLDGTGYWSGRKANELDFIDRLLACTDIYQAVSEERPYHSARSHKETMGIMYSMAEKGFIDSGIVEDFDIAMAPYSLKKVPDPKI